MLRINAVEPNPSRGLAGAIDFSCTIRNMEDRVCQLDARADVVLKHPIRGQIVLGEAFQSFPHEAVEYQRQSGEGQVVVTLRLNTALIHEIEELRASGDLNLILALTVVAARLDNADKGPVVRRRMEHHMKIAKSDWVEKYLPIFGWGPCELWEVRFPVLPTPGPIMKEKNYLDQAVQDYDKGEYEDAFKDCRNVIQSFKKRSDELGLASLVGKEEWKRANDYLSTALHVEEEIPHKIVRADAEFAITLAWAIFRRVAHSLEKPKATPEPAPMVRLKDSAAP